MSTLIVLKYIINYSLTEQDSNKARE